MEPGLYHIRWRSQEFLLVTILILAAIAGFVRPVLEMSPEYLANNYGVAFMNAHLEFDYYRNVLFPHLGFLALLYGCYCWINLYIIPYFLRGLSEQRAGPVFRLATSPGRIIWCVLNIFLLTALLGIGWGVAWSYLDYPTMINNHLTGAMVIGIGLQHVSGWAIGYVLYAAIREVAIRRMQQDQLKNAHWITVVNQVGGFFLIYYALGVVLLNFHLVADIKAMTDFFFIFLPPAVLTIYTNLYWVFPIKGEGNLWRGWRGRPRQRLLLSTACWLIPFLLYSIDNNEALIFFSIIFWAGQLAITTPVSWLIWRQRKDKLLQIQGLQTALGQSEADLQFLRSQINPHFLFNVLNTLYGTALQEGASRTAE